MQLAAFKLKGRALRNVALLISVPVLIWLLFIVFSAVLKMEANREPDSAFAAAGEFTAAMERLDTSDPYLFIKMEIDSLERTWTQTGPGLVKVGVVNINATCLREHFTISRALQLVEKASQAPGGTVKRK